MPRKKDLKRLTRSRMAKTGESYTTARTRLLEKKKGGKEATEKKAGGSSRKSAVAKTAKKTAAGDLGKLAGMSDDAVRAKTGRTWGEWVEVLDAVRAAAKPHKEIAEHVHEAHGVPGWWAQTVTVGYERIKGLREIGQRRSGSYEANKSKTLPVPLADLYRAFADKSTRKRWLPGAKLTVRKATAEKSMRITWEEDGSSVEVYFYAKGEAKSQVALQHRKLPSKAEAEKKKKFWGERLAELARVVA